MTTQSLIPVYPPGQSVDQNGNFINDAAIAVAAVAVVRFQSTDRLETGQVANLGSVLAARIVGGNSDRRVLVLRNEGVTDVYIGDRNVTATTGFRIGVGQSITLETGGEVFGITPSGTGVMHWLAEMEA